MTDTLTVVPADFELLIALKAEASERVRLGLGACRECGGEKFLLSGLCFEHWASEEVGRWKQ